MAADFEGTTYAIVRGDSSSEPLLFAVLFVWSTKPETPIPVGDARSVLTQLELLDEIFGEFGLS